MKTFEKSIIKDICIITMLLYSILALSKMDYRPLEVGGLSCILIISSYSIISKFFYKGDKFLLIIPLFITQFGLIMIYRINSALAFKQIVWFVLGLGIYMIIVIFLRDISRLEKFKYLYAIIAILLLSSTLFFGKEIKGSRNWLRIGKYSIQPSEIAKFFLIFYLASAIQDVKDFKDAVKISIPVFICIGLLVVEKDLGAGLIFFGIFITMVYIGTSDYKFILASLGVFIVGSIFSYFKFAHVRTRFAIWIDPWKDKYDKGNQICQSLLAIASGGLFGTGLGLGHPEFIPEVHNDCIFAAICEEFGLLGGTALILLYLILVYRGLRAAINAKDNFSSLVAVGISSMIGFQVFVIIGGVIKMIPLTGVTLPFVSYGGSSMILNFACLGVLQKISEARRTVVYE